MLTFNVSLQREPQCLYVLYIGTQYGNAHNKSNICVIQYSRSASNTSYMNLRMSYKYPWTFFRPCVSTIQHTADTNKELLQIIDTVYHRVLINPIQQTLQRA